MFTGSFVFRGAVVLYADGAWDCDDRVVLRQVVQQAARVAEQYSPAHGNPQAFLFDRVFEFFKKAGATSKARPTALPVGPDVVY